MSGDGMGLLAALAVIGICAIVGAALAGIAGLLWWAVS